ncbi:MAG TPA: efflux RND transporter periplasmic adaptor subunit [Burkholderiales bacterium]|nr:efflux RND transporter periplasmic adaptor subunit [Burkholderiales bacterium]
MSISETGAMAYRRAWKSVLACAGLLGAALALPAPGAEQALPHVVVAPGRGAERAGYDGVVEAVRQTVVAAQVAGAIVSLEIKVGDRVKGGQTLARIDARAAEQNTAASDAQVQSARAALEVATKEVERQRALFQKRYISEAALDRAEAQFKSTQAQVNAQLAQAGAARTQTGFFLVRAPYAGVVSEVPVSLGDMAMPGRALVTLYDPSALRVAAAVPQTAIPGSLTVRDMQVEIPGIAERDGDRLEPLHAEMLPTLDPASHTVIVRLDLPPVANVKPGMFARAWLPAAAGASRGRIVVPAQAIVRRAELTGVYVLDDGGRPLLRQVRLGRARADQIEVLTGVSAGDRVVTDPQAAARVPPPPQTGAQR